jgi:hypothetical protein
MFSTILALAFVVSAVLFVESISMLANRLILCKTDPQNLLKHGLERSTKSTASRTHEDIGNLYILEPRVTYADEASNEHFI